MSNIGNLSDWNGMPSDKRCIEKTTNLTKKSERNRITVSADFLSRVKKDKSWACIEWNSYTMFVLLLLSTLCLLAS